MFTRRPTRTTACLTLLTLLTLPAASTQAQVAEMQVGTRVRLRAPATVAGPLTGVVVARTADSVTVTRRDAPPIAVPIAGLTALEISRGKSRRRGAGKGALWGVAIMAGLSAIPFADRPCRDGQSGPDCDRISAGEDILISAVGGALVGAAIGVAVGAEHWVRATLPGQLAFTATPSWQRGHPSLRVGLRVATR